MAWYPPEYKEINDIDDLITQIATTLQYWLDAHTKPDAWAYGWIVDNVQYSFETTKGKLKNSYFTFDWKSAAYRQLAEKSQGDYVQCSECGSIWDNGSFDCDCETDENGYTVCEEQELEDTSYLVEWLQDIDAYLPDYILEQTLETDGFQAYREALEPVTRGIEEEISGALERYDILETNWDRLTWAREATRICHVNGNVLEDYGDHAELYSIVDQIRNDGFAEYFGEDEVREYLIEDE